MDELDYLRNQLGDIPPVVEVPIIQEPVGPDLTE